MSLIFRHSDQQNFRCLNALRRSWRKTTPGRSKGITGLEGVQRKQFTERHTFVKWRRILIPDVVARRNTTERQNCCNLVTLHLTRNTRAASDAFTVTPLGANIQFVYRVCLCTSYVFAK